MCVCVRVYVGALQCVAADCALNPGLVLMMFSQIKCVRVHVFVRIDVCVYMTLPHESGWHVGDAFSSNAPKARKSRDSKGANGQRLVC